MMLRLLLIVLSALLPASRAMAQVADTPQPPAHLGVVDGAASVTREGHEEEALASAPLVEGDTVRTSDGRVEILLIDGSALYVDDRSVVDVQSSTIFRLLEGQATVILTGTTGDGSAVLSQLDTPAASILFEGAGEYRIAASTDERGALAFTELAVVRGAARLETDSGRLLVRTGERSSVREGEPPAYPQAFNSARWSVFDRWVRDRQVGRTASRSTAFLPNEIQAYASAFDSYGTWGQEPDYGDVWYPTSVGPGWRPYYNGHWRHFGTYGWNWVGGDPWGWPTHHYGNWGFNRGTWFWRPGRVWAPSRVWWALSPGYVSWCPLGINGRPVFGFWGHPGSRFVGDPWRGWTVVSRGAFGSRAHLGSIALDGRAVARDPHAAFVVQRTAPQGHFAVPRSGGSAFNRAGAVASTSRVAIAGRREQSGRTFAPMPGALGSRRGGSGETRVERPSIGMMPIYPYAPNRQAAESPYRSAERIASERRATGGRQAVPRSGLPPRAAPSPYPPQFQAPIAEPFRPSYGTSFSRTPSRSVDGRGGRAGARGAGIAVPRPGPTPGPAAMPRALPLRMPRGAQPSIHQAPPTMVPAAPARPASRGTAVPRGRP